MQLMENVNSANPVVVAGLPVLDDLGTATGATALNAEIERQVSYIADLNDFRIMLVATLVALPFLLLMRRRENA